MLDLLERLGLYIPPFPTTPGTVEYMPGHTWIQKQGKAMRRCVRSRGGRPLSMRYEREPKKATPRSDGGTEW
jgi:hypothetical protein